MSGDSNLFQMLLDNTKVQDVPYLFRTNALEVKCAGSRSRSKFARTYDGYLQGLQGATLKFVWSYPSS